MEQERSKNTSRMSYPYKKKYVVDGEKKIHSVFSVTKKNSMRETLDLERIHRIITWACTGYESIVNIDLIVQEVMKNVFDGISLPEIADALTLSTITFIEQDPAYSYVAARLLFKKLFKEVTGFSVTNADTSSIYKQTFINGITKGVDTNLFDTRMLDFDLTYLAHHMKPKRDSLFDYMGLRTLYERYFIQYEKRRLELPQAFWMRIAMGLAYNESHKNEKAVTFYTIMSTLRYVPSTPTLLHAGLGRPQLSSCFLSTVKDDLSDIFKCFGDNAQLSKWSGGVANDWSNVRAVGSMVNSIKTESQGVVPFLKIVNDTTAAINRSGKRRGATVVYLETWHLEIEDFLDLRKNTGDERRRTHDINTANWIPDLFMKRILADKQWTLFSPDEVSDLHQMYGIAFEKQYQAYEEKAQQGKIKLFKVVSAKQLWRKMISRLFETGHPWITFKDSCNIRSPQDHAGVIHSSNLCTEITLNTSSQETAVCNLGSINLARHTITGTLDDDLLTETVSIAMRMLDNVIDINFYPTKEAQTANLRHRPVGLGLMGLQNALYQLNINFADKQACVFSDEVMEKIAYHAIFASSKLAKERGVYSSYIGSKWDRNIFPQDTIVLLEQERGLPINIKKDGKLDWAPVRQHVQQYGMRNSNTMAIAPTATIANISGVFPSIEPIYKNLYVKSNMNGEFTVINQYLIKDLQADGLWDKEMLDQIKYYDGNLQMIDRISQQIKDKYKGAFEIDQIWLTQIAAARGKWIDQSQSHNIFMQGVSGKKISEIYIMAWQLGLKTTYYLRTLSASQIEKSTLDAKKFGFTQKRSYTTMNNASKAKTDLSKQTNGTIQACNILEDPSCEACQ